MGRTGQSDSETVSQSVPYCGRGNDIPPNILWSTQLTTECDVPRTKLTLKKKTENIHSHSMEHWITLLISVRGCSEKTGYYAQIIQQGTLPSHSR